MNRSIVLLLFSLVTLAIVYRFACDNDYTNLSTLLKKSYANIYFLDSRKCSNLLNCISCIAPTLTNQTKEGMQSYKYRNIP